MRFIIFENNNAKFLFMISKILIGTGILMIVAGIAPIVWEIYRMMTETAGIGSGSGVISIFLVFVGIIFAVAGAIKFRKDKRFQKYS